MSAGASGEPFEDRYTAAAKRHYNSSTNVSANPQSSSFQQGTGSSLSGQPTLSEVKTAAASSISPKEACGSLSVSQQHHASTKHSADASGVSSAGSSDSMTNSVEGSARGQSACGRLTRATRCLRDAATDALNSMAALSLLVLVLQNSTLVLLTRYSRFSHPPSETYHTSTLVLNQEVMKMAFCLAIFAYERKQQDPHADVVSDLRAVVFQEETLKLIVPAALFTLQNFLIFVALSHLDAMTFQVLSQTKLLSAAVFSVWLLDRRLNLWQWVSLVLLTVGVYFSQAEGHQKESFAKVSATALSPAPFSSIATKVPVALLPQSFVFGAVACIISGLSSSFAGVYFEKVVKTTAPSLAVRNIHLSLFGIPFAVLSMLVLDVFPPMWNPRLPKFRFWQGYDAMTWCLVLVHAFGGLLVAVVVKYADNILKGFATGVAVIVSGAFAAVFWEYKPSLLFVLGCVLVTASSMLYHTKDRAASGRGAKSLEK